MVEKATVLASFQKNNHLSILYKQWFDKNYDKAHNIASKAKTRMPGIGIMSGRKRLNAFYAVCVEVADEIMKQEDFDRLAFDENWAYASLILQILRHMDSNFDVAALTFEKMARYLKPHEVQQLPELAILYAEKNELGLNI